MNDQQSVPLQCIADLTKLAKLVPKIIKDAKAKNIPALIQDAKELYALIKDIIADCKIK